MTLKKGIAFTLAIIMTFNLTMTAFASDITEVDAGSNLTSIEKAEIQENISTYTTDTVKDLSLEELQYASTVAETEEAATVIFDALVDKYATGAVEATAKASLISNYVQFVKATKSGKNVTVKYRIKAKIPNGTSISLVYEFPAATRTKGASASLSGKKVGEYTQKFTVPTLMCQSRICTKMTARDYKETKVHETYNYKSKVYTDYHAVTKAEAEGELIVKTVAPALIVTAIPKARVAKIVRNAINVGGFVASATVAASVSIGPPDKAAGQYYKTQTWYANNKIYVKLKVWHSKAAFDHGDLPIYDGKAGVAAKLPTF